MPFIIAGEGIQKRAQTPFSSAFPAKAGIYPSASRVSQVNYARVMKR
jgi:hypothetical protein